MIGFFAPEVVVDIERPSKSASVADGAADAEPDAEPCEEDIANASNPADAGAACTGVFWFNEANKSFDGAGAGVGAVVAGADAKSPKISVAADAGGGIEGTGDEKSNKSTTLGSGADAGAATGLTVREGAEGVGRDANAGGGRDAVGGAGPSSLP